MRLEEEVILMKVFKWEAAGTKGSEGKLNLSCSLGAINQPVKQHKSIIYLSSREPNTYAPETLIL